MKTSLHLFEASCMGCTFKNELFTNCLLTYKATHKQAPPYITDFCQSVVSVASRISLRSAVVGLLLNPRIWTKFEDCSFAITGPREWNSLPPEVCQADSITTFKGKVKSYLFRISYQ